MKTQNPNHDKQPKTAPTIAHVKPYTLVTGGAGFIGTNLCKRLLAQGRQVLVFDNLSRPGVEKNLQWLKRNYPGQVDAHIADVRDARAVREAAKGAESVFHFAAQVAVTTSLEKPVLDFEVNAQGTLNVLEAVRQRQEKPAMLFTSTNKVYGGLPHLKFEQTEGRYCPSDPRVQEYGISEKQPLDFHSPYGCSKGTADQYIADYARTYGLPSAVFRMSCVYGPHQYGTEDQGWVAHFLIRALEHKPITIYGNGKQVRDILFVEDLVDAFLLAEANIGDLKGQAFNIGGGPQNALSLLELVAHMEEVQGEKIMLDFGEWRPGDQAYYVSDCRKFVAATEWKRKYAIEQGIKALYDWLTKNRATNGHDQRKPQTKAKPAVHAVFPNS